MTVQMLIEKFSKRGRGVAAHGNAHVEVIGGIPGDRVEVELSRKRKGWHKGFLRSIEEPSPLRVAPRCAHVPTCGGCSWQQLEYQEQLRLKEERVKHLFLGKEGVVRPIVGCQNPWEYRNKMEFSFSQNRLGERFLGLMQAGGKSRVVNLYECHLVSSWFTEALNGVREWWERSGLLAYQVNNEGTLRTLILREGKRTGDKLALLTVSGNPEFAIGQEQVQGFVEAIQRVAPGASIFLRIQQAVKGSPTQFYEIHLAGLDHIKERLDIFTGYERRSLLFKVSPTSFFQTHPAQAEILYSEALQMVDLPPGSSVFDLYAGTATLGMALALRAALVIAIELNPHAVFDAQASALLNGIHNLQLICGDVGAQLSLLRSAQGFESPHLAIVDPPRGGLDPLALEHLLALRPQQILYISCNPETQAQNVAILEAGGYLLKVVQPVDQFPHTPHIENIALLERCSVF